MAFHEIKIGSTNYTLAPQYIKNPDSANATGDYGFLLFQHDATPNSICKLYSPGSFDLPSIKYSGGNLCIEGNILPVNNNGHSVGSSSQKFNKMYATKFYGDLDGTASKIKVMQQSLSEATYYISFVDYTSGNKNLLADAGLKYLPWSNELTAGVFNGRFTGPLQTTATSTNASYYITFANSSSDGWRYSYVDSGLYYNPSTNELSAGGGFYERSDERLKDLQEDIEVNFSYLHNIPKKYYSWKDDTTYTRHIGTSAQEVQKYYPELVNADENGYLTMNYDKLSVVALKAIDVLHEEVAELKKENAELKERLARLEELILNK
jgi:hypothetical protein